MKEETKEGHPTPLPVDRNWIDKLLKKYPNPNARLKDKALVVAPMVDQSDLPFRLLCQNYGANLSFTPMIHARMLLECKQYQTKFLGNFVTHDRPLIAQLCGSDPDRVLAAARKLEPYVDGIDINCGCPQNIARRGHYGAYLLDEEEELLTLVRHLSKHLRVPLSVKVRKLPNLHNDPAFDSTAASLRLYKKLVEAGIHLLTIHGRNRFEKGQNIAEADWNVIRKSVELFGTQIPIFANGGVETFAEVEKCLKVTGVDGVMSSESLLEYPPIFFKTPQTPVRQIGRVQVSQEYMKLAKAYPPEQGGQGSGPKCIRAHLHHFLHPDLQNNPTLRDQLVSAKSVSDLEAVVDECEKYHKSLRHRVEDERLRWYCRHREEEQAPPPVMIKTEEDKLRELQEEADRADCNTGLFNEADDGDY